MVQRCRGADGQAVQVEGQRVRGSEGAEGEVLPREDAEGGLPRVVPKAVPRSAKAQRVNRDAASERVPCVTSLQVLVELVLLLVLVLEVQGLTVGSMHGTHVGWCRGEVRTTLGRRACCKVAMLFFLGGETLCEQASSTPFICMAVTKGRSERVARRGAVLVRANTTGSGGRHAHDADRSIPKK